MKEENIIRSKSYAFAIRIVRLYKYLVEGKHEFVLSKQLLHCGTSIGVNVEEAIGAQTKKDFFLKITIAYKECRETSYWINILKDTNYLNLEECKSILHDCEELLRILGSIQKKIRQSQTSAP
jgi:four helix bundle protein